MEVQKRVSNWDDTLNNENIKHYKIHIVHTKWNLRIVNALKDGCYNELLQCGIDKNNITFSSVPGSFELPLAGQLALNRGADAVICIGVLIKGETKHFDYISEAVSHGIMQIGLKTSKPAIFGVLTCLSTEQTEVRAGIVPDDNKEANVHNHGIDWARTAVELVTLCRQSEN